MPAIACMGLVSPVKLRERHAVAARAQLALGLKTQQAITAAQGLQRQTRAEVAEHGIPAGRALICQRRYFLGVVAALSHPMQWVV